LSRAQALALVEAAAAQALTPKSYFGPLADRPGFHRALQATFEELRAAGVSPGGLPSAAFTDARKSKELGAILGRYDAALAKGRSVDRAEVLRRALAAVAARPPAPGAWYLLPAGLELPAVERRLLESIAGGRLLTLADEPASGWTGRARHARLFRATGEENEIREVFRRCFAGGIPWDEVEILYTDPSAYPALLWELSREQDVPLTFGSGIGASFTRPGQAALAFLRWIGEGFAADRLREALASGALTLARMAEGADEPSGRQAVARALRDAQIGWGARRHRACLDRLVAELEAPEEFRRDAEPDEDERAAHDERRRRRLSAARRAREFADRAVALASPLAGGRADPGALARGCRLFVTEFARVSDPLDGVALTALQKLLEELEVLPPIELPVEDTVGRLLEAVRKLSIGADRPRAGRAHAAHFPAGGFSGRRHTYLLGLDEARHPGSDLEDPVLLDDERRNLNRLLAPVRLPMHRERPRDTAAALQSCVARVSGDFTASYSSWRLRSLDQQSEQFPSPFFLALHREAAGDAGADYSALLAALPEAAGFAPGTDAALDDTEWWLSRLRGMPAGAAAPALRALHPHLEEGHRAETARDSDVFTVYDGWISSGTPELDPRVTGKPQSASRLQELAKCPFSYFLRSVLYLEPPKSIERDASRWLDPMMAGSLLHEVFRQFFEKITEAGEKPEAARHAGLIEELAEAQIRGWREKIPPASELAFEERRGEILFAGRAFLKLEEVHCRAVVPRFFEVPFGLPRATVRGPVGSREAVEISVGGGRNLSLRGSIDRVDEAPDGTFHVWDYKTGGAFSFREKLGIHGGRRIQPALYAMALEVLLERAGMRAPVSRSGYFFPGKKGEGQRIPVALDPDATRDVLGRLLDLLAAGAFPHSDTEEDCRFCDYEAVCGGARGARDRVKAKLAKATLPALQAFQEIHGRD
jgi:ATP-dependent helicase/nuclease subunit B